MNYLVIRNFGSSGTFAEHYRRRIVKQPFLIQGAIGAEGCAGGLVKSKR